MLKRPQVSLTALLEHIPQVSSTALEDAQVAEQVEIQTKYQGYVDRQRVEVDRTASQGELPIPADFDYRSIKSLSHEVLHKLLAARPQTIGQASRISGVTPAAISLLLVSLKRQAKASVAAISDSRRTPAGSPSQDPAPAGTTTGGLSAA